MGLHTSARVAQDGIVHKYILYMTLTFEPMTLGSKVKAILVLENLVTKISHKLVEGSLPNLTC